jgi:hypothetical protein
MALAGSIALFDFAAGAVSAVALVYLLYAETVAVHYPRFFRTILVGLLAFAITGPVIGTFAPAFIHAAHAVAGLFVTIGLYGLLARELEEEEQFAGLFGD